MHFSPKLSKEVSEVLSIGNRVFASNPGYCFWPFVCYYHQWLRYSKHTLALNRLHCPLPLDLYPYLDDSEAERTKNTTNPDCFLLRVVIKCLIRLYIKQGKWKEKGKTYLSCVLYLNQMLL